MQDAIRMRSGFTLIELLLAIAIIAMLAAIVIVAINPTKQLAEARNSGRRQDIKQVISAIQQYVIETGASPSGIDTTLRMIGTDTTGCDVSCGSELGPEAYFSAHVTASGDDAEEEIATNDNVYVQSTDLELVRDYNPSRGDQLIGIRFQNVTVPQGAVISNATIRFRASMIDGNGNEATSLTISGQDSDDAVTFDDVPNDISVRPRTTATVAWNSVPNWTVDGGTHDTPDFSPVLQEIIDRTGWTSGNDLAVMIEGTGRRPAYAYDEGIGLEPILSFTYQIAGMTHATCLNLNVLTGSYVTALPTDPKLGTSAKTYYAVKRVSTNRLRLRACGAELDEDIFLDQ